MKLLRSPPLQASVETFVASAHKVGVYCLLPTCNLQVERNAGSQGMNLEKSEPYRHISGGELNKQGGKQTAMYVGGETNSCAIYLDEPLLLHR